MTEKNFQTARGVRDILPAEQKYWQHFRKTAEAVLNSLGIERIDIPHFENIEIFQRSIGENTDIIQKEVYLLESRGDEEQKIRFALRPEGTAGVVRAYIQNGMQSWPQPVKLYYEGAMFRHDRPQKGRYREFFQIGTEIFGDPSAKADYLVVMSAWEILKRLGLKNIIVYLNSIGCSKCRPKYIAKLKKYYKDKVENLCPNCQNRYEKNPLRLLDCKEPSCATTREAAPIIIDTLCPECKDHFQNLLEYLDYFGIRYDLDHHLVRGLDYYNRTVFEFATEDDKDRNTSLGGGGRYDELVELLGGSSTPAVGFSFGSDRIVNLMKDQKIKIAETPGVEISILQLGETAKSVCKKIYDDLTAADINVYFIPNNDSLRSQIRSSAKLGAKYALIIGQKEALKEEVILRDLMASSQETFPVDQIADELKKRLKK